MNYKFLGSDVLYNKNIITPVVEPPPEPPSTFVSISTFNPQIWNGAAITFDMPHSLVSGSYGRWSPVGSTDSFSRIRPFGWSLAASTTYQAIRITFTEAPLINVTIQGNGYDPMDLINIASGTIVPVTIYSLQDFAFSRSDGNTALNITINDIEVSTV